MKNQPLQLLGKTIPTGRKTIINLETARLHTHNKIEVPVIVQRGKEPGPVLLLLGGIHGNEINGVEIIRELISKKYNKPTSGTIICIPALNVFGFLNQTREFPDGKDLNRMFPGTQNGSMASLFAWNLMNNILPAADYIVDFHTGGTNRFNSSQIRISKEHPELFELANIFKPRFIVLAPDREKSFRQAATKLGKKILLFEGGKSLDIHNRITQRGVNGVLRLMDHLGMRDYSEEIAEMPKIDPIFIRESTWIRARHGGMFRFQVKDGAKVEKGDIIGSISDPYGEFERAVKIPESGYIIGLNHAPIVYQGDALIHLGKV
ncbi:succinylglutamate desuccinylase/aspartoacylase family protein [Mangrovibacterium lignilyticum]|uniref:succinylglutamate desuccinylase/aspartoacylase family protein n=1 Tax=Mangrovibacterium lignilyticum TaxID=2668052 RepID=UPI0013D16457|nr:succinylglutamate desuccinylase/aspartoacylase family protein [Mangrovibacterium lignilyticum]